MADHYRCSICLEFLAPSLKLFLVHIGRVHASEVNFHVSCGLDGCGRTYNKFVSFRHHLFRKHSEALKARGNCSVEVDNYLDDSAFVFFLLLIVLYPNFFK